MCLHCDVRDAPSLTGQHSLHTTKVLITTAAAILRQRFSVSASISTLHYRTALTAVLRSSSLHYYTVLLAYDSAVPSARTLSH
jgi:hypothetical protein